MIKLKKWLMAKIIDQIPKLAEEKELIEKLSESNRSPEAIAKMTERYAPLVKGLVSTYKRRNKFSEEDIVQEGMIGLLKAIKNFKSDVGVRFYTYATVVIRTFIEKAMKEEYKWNQFATTSMISFEDKELSLEDLLAEDLVDNNDSLLQKLDGFRFDKVLNTQELEYLRVRYSINPKDLHTNK